MVSAYYSGDTTTMFKTLGAAAPGALGQVAVETAKWEIGFALVKKAAQLASISRRVTQATMIIGKLSEVPAGRILDLEEMGRLWGLAKEDVTAFETIANEEGVVIGVRGRAPISVERIEEGAVWKHENLKPKNVNIIDSTYLGFPSSDAGLVAFRSYSQEEKIAIIKRIRNSGLTAEQQQVVFNRATTRFNESSKYLKKIEGFASEKKIDVGFNYRENGLDLDTTSEIRKFALDEKQLADGGTYYKPLQEKPTYEGLSESGTLPKECVRRLGAVLCRVTGDMDGVYVTNVGGTSLDPTKLARVYDKLAAAGWQHPETLTWVKGDGSFYFSAKAKILKGLEKGGEAMVEFAPDRVARATYLDLSKSWLFSPQSFYSTSTEASRPRTDPVASGEDRLVPGLRRSVDATQSRRLAARDHPGCNSVQKASRQVAAQRHYLCGTNGVGQSIRERLRQPRSPGNDSVRRQSELLGDPRPHVLGPMGQRIGVAELHGKLKLLDRHVLVRQR